MTLFNVIFESLSVLRCVYVTLFNLILESLSHPPPLICLGLDLGRAVIPPLEELKAGACHTPLIMPQPAQADLGAGFQALPVPNNSATEAAVQD